LALSIFRRLFIIDDIAAKGKIFNNPGRDVLWQMKIIINAGTRFVLVLLRAIGSIAVTIARMRMTRTWLKSDVIAVTLRAKWLKTNFFVRKKASLK
jgi:hypothetical protein